MITFLCKSKECVDEVSWISGCLPIARNKCRDGRQRALFDTLTKYFNVEKADYALKLLVDRRRGARSVRSAPARNMIAIASHNEGYSSSESPMTTVALELTATSCITQTLPHQACVMRSEYRYERASLADSSVSK